MNMYGFACAYVCAVCSLQCVVSRELLHCDEEGLINVLHIDPTHTHTHAESGGSRIYGIQIDLFSSESE